MTNLITTVPKPQLHGVVENDETMIAGRWFRGAIQRKGHRAVIEIAPDRSETILTAKIRKHIEEGFIVLTDEWRGYNPHPRFFNHYTVNHSREFVHPKDRRIHTNTIEGLWARIKRKLHHFCNGAPLHNISDYLNEYFYLKNYAQSSKSRCFCAIIFSVFFVADLHLHSKYSRATSREMNLENLWKWGQFKGIRVISAADFTHPLWFAEIEQKLQEAEPGLYKLSEDIEKKLAGGVPESCKSDTRFILTTEISSIYSKNGRVRKVHNIIFAPNLETARKINMRLTAVGNLRSDGRPILGLDSKHLLKIILDISRDCALVPAHAWTPHFSVFGSNSGFDSLEECFEDMTPHIFAVETGLSSDPEMNWRFSALDNITLISNSDSHSLPKLGRECNVFDTDLSYGGIIDAMHKQNSAKGRKLLMTVEFFPEEGKYHFDGHRACNVRLHPEESAKHNNICPACGRSVTIGVLNRVAALADRKESFALAGAPPFKKLIPLNEIIAEAFGTETFTVKAAQEYQKLINHIGNELKILLKAPLADISRVAHPLIAEGVKRVREDNVHIEAGYDGEYGVIHIFTDEERRREKQKQAALF